MKEKLPAQKNRGDITLSLESDRDEATTAGRP